MYHLFWRTIGVSCRIDSRMVVVWVSEYHMLFRSFGCKAYPMRGSKWL
jgi:hypothetical protein